MLRALVSLYHM